MLVSNRSNKGNRISTRNSKDAPAILDKCINRYIIRLRTRASKFLVLKGRLVPRVGCFIFFSTSAHGRAEFGFPHAPREARALFLETARGRAEPDLIWNWAPNFVRNSPPSTGNRNPPFLGGSVITVLRLIIYPDDTVFVPQRYSVITQTLGYTVRHQHQHINGSRRNTRPRGGYGNFDRR